LQTRSYDKKDGTKAYITEVNVNEFKFLDSIKKENKPQQTESEKVIDNFGENKEEIDINQIPF